jgi:hypothetical protein
MSGLEVTGSSLAVLVATAQMAPSDDLVTNAARGGAIAIVGALFWMFMKLHAKTVSDLAAAHKEALERLIEGHNQAVNRIESAHAASAEKFDKIAVSVSDMVKHCSERNAR